jgi:hypothetical protein
VYKKLSFNTEKNIRINFDCDVRGGFVIYAKFMGDPMIFMKFKDILIIFVVSRYSSQFDEIKG